MCIIHYNYSHSHTFKSPFPLCQPQLSLQTFFLQSGPFVLFFDSLDFTSVVCVTMVLELSIASWWAYQWVNIQRQ